MREIENLQQKCKDELFNMHQAKLKGKLVDMTESYKKILKDVDSLQNKIDIVDIESELL